MNPFTAALLKQIDDRRLVEFARRWDELEALVIRVFKGKAAQAGDAREHRRSRAWLQANYPRWEPELARYWPQARLAGGPAKQDPFAFLLNVDKAEGFIGNWAAMQNLPAAREALNQYLADRIEAGRDRPG
jgi:hypothetical protein